MRPARRPPKNMTSPPGQITPRDVTKECSRKFLEGRTDFGFSIETGVGRCAPSPPPQNMTSHMKAPGRICLWEIDEVFYKDGGMTAPGPVYLWEIGEVFYRDGGA